MIICKHPLNNGLLVLYINGVSKYAVDDNSIGRHNEFCMLSNPPSHPLFCLSCAASAVMLVKICMSPLLS
jgi:hypothetical protein